MNWSNWWLMWESTSWIDPPVMTLEELRSWGQRACHSDAIRAPRWWKNWLYTEPLDQSRTEIGWIYLHLFGSQTLQISDLTKHHQCWQEKASCWATSRLFLLENSKVLVILATEWLVPLGLFTLVSSPLVTTQMVDIATLDGGLCSPI